MAKALEHGYISKEYKDVLVRGFNGLMEHMTEEDGEALRVKGICIGTSTGTYDYYVDRPTSTDDLHGVGAFLFAMMALYDYVK
nr:glycoside hydrolase family 88 protein [Alkalibacterium olivapovliticus]